MYGAIARVGGRAALRYAPRIAATRAALRSRAAYAKYGAIGNEVFHMAYRYGKRKYKRMRRSGRRLLGRPSKRRRISRSKRMNHFGDPINAKIIAKRDLVSSTLAPRLSRTLHTTEITVFTPRQDGTGNQQLYYRERDAIRFVGFRLNFYIKNTSNSDILLNVAIVAAKNLGTPDPANFVRTNSAILDDRSNSVANLGGLFLHYARINADDYEIIMHKRYKLGPAQETATTGDSGKNYLHINRYFPINRKFTFAGVSDQTPQNGRLFLVRWYGRPTDTSLTTPENLVTDQPVITNFFRDLQG